MIAIDALGLTRLLQLASPALPVGAYAYSQGLESAIEGGAVRDAGSAQTWIADVLEFNVGSFEAPILWRLSGALAVGDMEAYARWNAIFRASRETAELRAESLQMAHALIALMGELTPSAAPAVNALRGGATYPAAFSCAAHHLGVERSAALIGYLWSWLENQVMAVLKAVPLGHAAGQRMLAAMGAELPHAARRAMKLADDELSNYAPAYAIASSRHETQYSRLFRS
jgi:urease accessory protein